MQYLLTEKEYINLVSIKDQRTKEELKQLQKFCTRVANELPIVRDWDSDKTPRPWTCMLTHNNYCDDCPAQEICPHPSKDWSK